MRYKKQKYMGLSPGDIIKVIYPTKCYDMFERMKRLLNLQNYNKGVLPSRIEQYIITHIEKHSTHNDVYVIVIKSLEDSKEYIMDPNGLVKYEI